MDSLQIVDLKSTRPGIPRGEFELGIAQLWERVAEGQAREAASTGPNEERKRQAEACAPSGEAAAARAPAGTPEGRRLPSRRGWWAVFWALNIERLQRALGVALLSAGRELLGLDRPEGAR